MLLACLECTPGNLVFLSEILCPTFNIFSTSLWSELHCFQVGRQNITFMFLSDKLSEYFSSDQSSNADLKSFIARNLVLFRENLFIWFFVLDSKSEILTTLVVTEKFQRKFGDSVDRVVVQFLRELKLLKLRNTKMSFYA